MKIDSMIRLSHVLLVKHYRIRSSPTELHSKHFLAHSLDMSRLNATYENHENP